LNPKQLHAWENDVLASYSATLLNSEQACDV